MKTNRRHVVKLARLPWAGEVSNVSLPAAIGLKSGGYRKILGIYEGAKEDKSSWSGFYGTSRIGARRACN